MLVHRANQVWKIAFKLVGNCADVVSVVGFENGKVVDNSYKVSQSNKN